MLKTSLFRCTQLSGTLISSVDSSLREALTRHDLSPGYVTIFTPGKDEFLVYVAPDRTIAIVEDAAVVAGRRLAVVVGGVHAVRFVLRVLYLGAVEDPRLAFRTIPCVGERAGVDRTKRGVDVPARRS